MKKFMLAAVVLVSVALPALAKNFAVPEKNPVATLAIPDNWKTEEIEYGYSARSPDNDIFFSAEYATGARVDAMLENNSDWLKENKITSKEKPAEFENRCWRPASKNADSEPRRRERPNHCGIRLYSCRPKTSDHVDAVGI